MCADEDEDEDEDECDEDEDESEDDAEADEVEKACVLSAEADTTGRAASNKGDLFDWDAGCVGVCAVDGEDDEEEEEDVAAEILAQGAGRLVAEGACVADTED